MSGYETRQGVFDLVHMTPRHRAQCRDGQTGTVAIWQCENRQLPGECPQEVRLVGAQSREMH